MIQQALKSFLYVFRAPQLLTRYRLWPYAIAPIIVTLVIGVSIMVGVWQFRDGIGDWMLSWVTWEWAQGFKEVIDGWLANVVIGIATLLVGKYLILIASSPFMSMLSAKMEEKMMGAEEKPFELSAFISDLIRGLRVSVRNLLRELIIVIPLWLLSFIPMVNFVTVPLIFLVQSYYAGFGNMDFTMERYYDVQNSILFVRKHRAVAIGNGAAFMLLFMIPIVGAFFCLVLTATAAAHQTIQLIDDEEF